jgi:hypothetical protein
VPDLVAPAYLSVPPRVGSYGAEACDLTEMAGRILDDEQRLAVDAMLSYGPGGRWVALESAVLEARQNGKTGGIILPSVLFDMFLMPPDRIVWTAHIFRTARDAFNDILALIEGCSDLSRRVKKVNASHGEESIELHKPAGGSATRGAKLEFLARSKGGGRGLGGKRIVMDEALFLSAEAMGALMPTLAARSMLGDPHIMYGSSAGVLGSDHLRGLRNRGRKGGDPSLVYAEWCAPGSWDEPGCDLGPECPHMPETDGCALDDETLWPLANHALGRRISYDYVRAERRALPPEEFGRERLGWFTEPAGIDVDALIEKWTACGDDGSQPSGRPVFMIDASPGLKSAAIVACMWRPDGRPHLEVVAHEPGSTWLPARAARLQKHRPLDWVIDPGGPAGALLPDLRLVGIDPREMSMRDMGQACSAFVAAVEDEWMRHLNDQVMLRALKAADKRDIGDGLWAWSRRKSGGDITVLVGATGALWGLSVSPPPQAPPPPPVVTTVTAARSETSALATAGF